MSRHRNVRSMNIDDEYAGYDDVYGHSVEDDFCVSPATAAQFIYNRDGGHEFAHYMRESEIPEEEEGRSSENEGLNDSGRFKPPVLSDTDQARLSQCLEEMHNVLGESHPECDMIVAIMNSDFNCERALNALLSKQEEPKPQRQARETRRSRTEDDDVDDVRMRDNCLDDDSLLLSQNPTNTCPQSTHRDISLDKSTASTKDTRYENSPKSDVQKTMISLSELVKKRDMKTKEASDKKTPSSLQLLAAQHETMITDKHKTRNSSLSFVKTELSTKQMSEMKEKPKTNFSALEQLAKQHEQVKQHELAKQHEQVKLKAKHNSKPPSDKLVQHCSQLETMEPKRNVPPPPGFSPNYTIKTSESRKETSSETSSPARKCVKLSPMTSEKELNQNVQLLQDSIQFPMNDFTTRNELHSVAGDLTNSLSSMLHNLNVKAKVKAVNPPPGFALQTDFIPREIVVNENRPRISLFDLAAEHEEKILNTGKTDSFNSFPTNILSSNSACNSSFLSSPVDSSMIAPPSSIAQLLTRNKPNKDKIGRKRFPRFSLADQCKDGRKQIVTFKRLNEIKEFDFSTKSPDDVIRDKQKGAFMKNSTSTDFVV